MLFEAPQIMVFFQCITGQPMKNILKGKGPGGKKRGNVNQRMRFTFYSALKAEHRRIDAFELWCWRRLLRAPWTARRSKQSILKKINPKYSLKGLMLKLKL